MRRVSNKVHARKGGVSALWLNLGSLAAFALAWELLARQLHSLLLPTFAETAVALVRLMGTARLWRALWISNQAMLLGFAAAAAVGVPLGLLMGRHRAAERYLDPYVNILMATSMSALIPIAIMAVGLGLLSRVIVVFCFAVVVIAVNARAGVRAMDPAWVEMARSFGASGRQLWQRVLLQGALPAILTGLRLGLARAIAGMVSVELLLVALGIGRLILEYQGEFDGGSLFATMLVVVAEALLLSQLFHRAERRLVSWAGDGVAT